ncbi:MAG: helix-turn-helix transcriptional regulator [Oscillospiraceae bacterium]|nr:helix-turn-helix transcriptional regulator [Oscillospiraceae bacterium]
MTLGNRIKEQRNRLGLSQEKIAELVGISRQAVTKWETDQTIPCMENLIMLAEIFNITLVELTGSATSEVIAIPENAEIKPKKYFLGGWFVIVNLIVCVLYLFWGWIFDTNITIQSVLWNGSILMLSVIIYAIFASAVKSGDFSMIAGHDPKKKYNIDEYSRQCALISAGSSFFAMFASTFFLTIPLFDEIHRPLIVGLLVSAYWVQFAFIVLYANRKYKIVLED